MKADRTRILEMVAAGELSPADADRLLAAAARPRPPLARWLFQPMEILPTGRALAIGAAAALAGALVSVLLGVRFDGALDAHGPAPDPVPPVDAIVDLVLVWPVTALICWGVARLFTRQGRLVDFLAAVGVARAGWLILGLLIGTVGRAVDDGALLSVGPAELIFALALVLPVSAWAIALLVTGFRTASGLRGVRLAVGAVIALVLAEAITKLALWSWTAT